MEYFKLCLKVMLVEKMKFNLYEPDLIKSISSMTTFDVNYERPYERCAYMYMYAACHLNFMKDCFQVFLNKYSEIKKLLSMWKTCKNLQLCSMSHGPALDYLAFTIAIAENVEVELQKSFDTVKVISNSTQWRHAYGFIVDAIQMGYLNNFPVSMICDDIKIIKNNKQRFNDKQKGALQDVDILCMMKIINSQSDDISQQMKQYFKEIISSMKGNSLLFCIDTKPSVVALSKILFEFPGEYIFEPVCNIVKLPEKIPDFYKDQYGGLPVVNAKGWFFVWRKLSPNSIYNNIYPSILIEKSSSESQVKTSVSLATGLNFASPSASVSGLMNEIEKSFNESLKITDNCSFSNSLSNLHTSIKESSASVPSFICDYGNISINNTLTSKIKKDAEISNLNKSESAINQDKKCILISTPIKSDIKTSALQHNLKLDSCVTGSPSSKNLDRSISSSSNTSQSRKNDTKKPSSVSTPDKAKKNKNADLVKKTSDENKNEDFGQHVISSQFDNTKNKTKNKQVNNTTNDIPSKKKSVKVGTDLAEDRKSSIQDLTKRIQKLVSSFEDVISKNKQCGISKENVAGESFKHQDCCRSPCKSNFSADSNNESTSSNDVAKLPSFQSTEFAHSNQSVMETCAATNSYGTQGNAQASTHNPQCPRLQSCCKCRMQNLSSQTFENTLCCMRHYCNHETMPLNGMQEQGSHSGINLTGPNIIIPLQNINDDALAQLLKVLKTTSKQ